MNNSSSTSSTNASLEGHLVTSNNMSALNIINPVSIENIKTKTRTNPGQSAGGVSLEGDNHNDAITEEAAQPDPLVDDNEDLDADVSFSITLPDYLN